MQAAVVRNTSGKRRGAAACAFEAIPGTFGVQHGRNAV